MSAAEARWFIDAWSVLDGMAFASLRPEGSLNARATVFLCPPYFEPESMGNLATARAATRHAFQDRLFDADGVELSFADLEQLTEAVRLAYRAGSQGDLPEGGPSDEPSPAVEPDLPPGPTGAVLERLEQELEGEWADLRRCVLEPGMRAELRAAIAKFAAAAFRSGFVAKLVGSVLARVLHEASRRNLPTNPSSQILGLAQRAAGLCHPVELQPDGFIVGPFVWTVDELGPDAFHQLAFLRDRLFGGPIRFVNDPTGSFAPGSLPLPSGWAMGLDLTELATVEQAALALTTDRTLFERFLRPRAFMPLLLLALLRCVPEHLPHGWPQFRAGMPWYPRDWPGVPPWREAEIRDLAVSWLVQSLPSGRLAGHPVEQQIARLQRTALRVRAESMRWAHNNPERLDRQEWENDYRIGQLDQIAALMGGAQPVG